ncbi:MULTISPECIES: hypothetical protein [unclassified Sedimentibacter]|uniref:hypothetical protein n=1 Tax=unclassified Sedimentibacter TaxID=2649220 RepID=UPI0027E08F4C|nr:hypothetical protein [Sedimentibacter sp. MB35-C1]WMJ75732.1 hypothetical protein RBQ61_08805 [Sedimentibacter sp. MB35-C1]
MGESEIPRIALRGPGCISGTGRCDVLGTGGRRCNNILGAGGRNCGNFRGTGGSGCNNNTAGAGGNRCNNVQGSGGSNRCHRCCCGWLWNSLETPITVPR